MHSKRGGTISVRTRHPALRAGAEEGGLVEYSAQVVHDDEHSLKHAVYDGASDDGEAASTQKESVVENKASGAGPDDARKSTRTRASSVYCIMPHVLIPSSEAPRSAVGPSMGP
jgi:hypothetical protein